MDTITLIAWISFILAIGSYVSGITSVLRKKAQPSIISRFFWLILSISNLLSYLSLGAGKGAFLAYANTLGSALIFLLSLRFGHIEFKRSDWFTIIGATLTFTCYALIHSKWIALIAGLLMHFISGIPTYKRAWINPYVEDLTFWLLFAVASACSLFAVIWQHQNFIYPLYFLFFDGGMVLLLLLTRFRLRQNYPVLSMKN